MTRTLKLSRTVVEDPHGATHRLSMWVSEAVGIAPEVFVYRRTLPPPESGLADPCDEFVNIASAADMAEYPINAPGVGGGVFFRKSGIDIIFRNPALLWHAYNTVKNDANALLLNLKRLDAVGVAGEDVLTV
jgi:hypothetical protein